MFYHLFICLSFLMFSCFNVKVLKSTDIEPNKPENVEITKEAENNEDDISYFNNDHIELMLSEVNTLRRKGCKCDGKYYAPVRKLKWNRLLYISAYKHAKSMHDNEYFSHYSPDGKDIGERLDIIGYRWQYAGENLAEGQKTFDEAMHDWIASPTHCIMLMNPNMEEMGVARYGSYWVQHFGKQMPKNAKRINERYSDGSK